MMSREIPSRSAKNQQATKYKIMLFKSQVFATMLEYTRRYNPV